MTDATQEQDAVHFSPDDELDLSGEGLQPTTVNVLIVSASVEEHEHGQRWQLIVEPEIEVEGLPNNQCRDGGFLSYSGPSEHDLGRIGRGILKRIFQAALGADKGRVGELEGKRMNVRISEGKTGFAQLSNYRQVRD